VGCLFPLYIQEHEAGTVRSQRTVCMT
jgi:hypothetical protein